MHNPTSPRAWSPFCLLLTLLALAVLAGCGRYGATYDVGDGATVYIEDKVKTPLRPEVYLHPKDHPDRELTALMFPFRFRQSIQNPLHYGRELGRVFWQVWLQEKIFPVMEFEEKRAWPGGQAAVAQARAKGADLAIGGDITLFMAGGSYGDSRLALRLEIYDAHSGALIWSLAHMGELTSSVIGDYILFKKRTTMPSDPIYAITVKLAEDMSVPLKGWIMPVRMQPAGESEL